MPIDTIKDASLGCKRSDADSSRTIRAYDSQAALLAAEYEALDPGAYRATFSDYLPAGAGRLALDVGAGSGRDAAWLARLGFQVIAVEPAAGMREAGRRIHTDVPVRWLDDQLPALAATLALGVWFDLILLSAVWQHVAPGERTVAFGKLVRLLNPGGLLVITLRDGPAPADRPMFEVSAEEVERLAGTHRLAVAAIERAPETLRRPDVSWTTMCLMRAASPSTPRSP